MKLNEKWTKIVENRRQSTTIDVNLSVAAAAAMRRARRVSFPTVSPIMMSSSEEQQQLQQNQQQQQQQQQYQDSEVSSRSSSCSKSTDLSGWFSKKINGIISQVTSSADEKSVGSGGGGGARMSSILTRTLSKATSRKSRASDCSTESATSIRYSLRVNEIEKILKRQKSLASTAPKFMSESKLLDRFGTIDETPYRIECRYIIEKYGLIIDDDNEDVLDRIVEGALIMEDVCMVQPSFWQNIVERTDDELIGFIDETEPEDSSNIVSPRKQKSL